MSTAAGATRVVEACRVEAVRLGHWPCEKMHALDRWEPVHCMTCRVSWPCPDAAAAPTSLLSRLALLLGDEGLARDALSTIEAWSAECVRCGETHVDGPGGWPADLVRHGAHMELRRGLLMYQLATEAIEGGYR